MAKKPTPKATKKHTPVATRKPVTKTKTAQTATTANTKVVTKKNSELPPQVIITLTHDQIANRAYEIWLAKGRPIGHDETIWRQAESELKIGM